VFESLLNAFRAPDIRRRILYVLGILIIFRLLAHVPVPGVDKAALGNFFEGNAIFGLLDLFSGGGLSNFSVIGLGLNPYINASIIMQLMTGVVPRLQELQREGEYGRNKINQYTRYLTVPLAALQAYGFLALLNSQGVLTTPFELASWETLTQIISLTAGSVLLMWLGELITEKGIGNGISFIIFAGIVSRAPTALIAFAQSPDLAAGIAFGLLAIAAVAVIIYIQEGQRRIPIQYASRVRGRRLYQGGQTFLPLRVNQAGVIPIIFAVSILLFPSQIAQYFTTSQITIVADIAQGIVNFFSNRLIYGLMYFLLTVGFTYFYTAFTFKPDETAEQLRKNGGFIPGIRPGRPTDHARRRPLPGHRGRVPVHRLGPAPQPRLHQPRRHRAADRRVGRRRDHEADRGPAAHAQLRGLHPLRTTAAGHHHPPVEGRVDAPAVRRPGDRLR
jgi:preprotein translocase subunit SecY